MTIEQLRELIPQKIAMLDASNNAANDIKSFLETAAGIIDPSNPISTTVTEQQLIGIAQIVLMRKMALDAAFNAIDLSEFAQ